MTENNLYEMYCQWRRGFEDYADNWVKFVELVAKDCKISEDEVIRQLQKYSWFMWPGH